MEKMFVIGYNTELVGIYKTLSSAINSIIDNICEDGNEFEFIDELIEEKVITQTQAEKIEDMSKTELCKYFKKSKRICNYIKDNNVCLDSYFIDELPVYD